MDKRFLLSPLRKLGRRIFIRQTLGIFKCFVFINEMSTLKGVKYIFFDWGGTLGKGHQRKTFIYSPFVKRKRETLKHDAIKTLRELQRRGYRMALVSNTGWNRDDMLKALKKMKMDQYFDFAVYSSDPGVCKKPCPQIFKLSVDIARHFVPYLRTGGVLYVGNNYSADMVGAKAVGMQTAFVMNRLPSSIAKTNRGRSHDIAVHELFELLKFV